MFRRTLALAALAASISACAPLPPLPALQAPAGAGVSTTLGPAGGYQEPNVNITVPIDAACNSVAYVDGYKAGYYQTWNQYIGPKESIYQLNATQYPTDQRIAFNNALYKGKRFNQAAFDSKAGFYLPMLSSPDLNKRCTATAYQKGQNTGTAAALTAYRALAAKER